MLIFLIIGQLQKEKQAQKEKEMQQRPIYYQRDSNENKECCIVM